MQFTVENGLCCGCGVCKGICPMDCISWEQKSGLYRPYIDNTGCIGCGLCVSVCPGLAHEYVPKDTAEKTVLGEYVECYNAWSKDAALRHVGASGGVVSTIIKALVESGRYDGAFCLDSYDCRTQLKTRLYTAEDIAECWSGSKAPKSRYLPVSHENAVAYMKLNRDKRLILVGTSCAIRGIIAAIDKLKLVREQYLLIGLFCDQVFNYNVLSYFSDTYANSVSINELHFKNKESGGWPGDMKFYPAEGEPFYVPLSKRVKAKSYFVLERCQYCVDKLNVCADISVGDNYTGQNSSELGSNSVIIRSALGVAVWDSVKGALEACAVEATAIQKAQAIDLRLNNLYYSDFAVNEKGIELDINRGVLREKSPEDFKSTYRLIRKKAEAGSIYDIDKTLIKRQMEVDEKKPNPIILFFKRGFRYLKRRLIGTK